jgi:hypothetical protein
MAIRRRRTQMARQRHRDRLKLLQQIPGHQVKEESETGKGKISRKIQRKRRSKTNQMLNRHRVNRRSRQVHNRLMTRRTIAQVARTSQVILNPLGITSKDNPAINRNKFPSQTVELPKEEIDNGRRRVLQTRIAAQMEETGATILPTPLKVIINAHKRGKTMKESVRAKVTLVHHRIGGKDQTKSKAMMTALIVAALKETLKGSLFKLTANLFNCLKMLMCHLRQNKKKTQMKRKLTLTLWSPLIMKLMRN